MIVARYSMAALILFLAGCSSQPQVTGTSGSWQQHSAKIAALDQWQVQGKLGFKSESQGWQRQPQLVAKPTAVPAFPQGPLWCWQCHY